MRAVVNAQRPGKKVMRLCQKYSVFTFSIRDAFESNQKLLNGTLGGFVASSELIITASKLQNHPKHVC